MSERVAGIAAARAEAFYAAEAETFASQNPRSQALARPPSGGFFDGVPMHWMRDWPLPFPLVVAEAEGASLADVDAHRLAVSCLANTGAMFAHSPPPVVAAVTAQAARGLATMLPSEDA